MIFTAGVRWDASNWPAAEARCALGKAGVIEAHAKREGDGTSPLGVWPIRRLLFRPDQGAAAADRPADQGAGALTTAGAMRRRTRPTTAR